MMRENDPSSLTPGDYRALADFRYQIRRFLHFSEAAAREEGLEPQQHQLLLAVRALDRAGGPTVRALAEYLLIRHHSTVELIDRLTRRGMLERVRGEQDRREVRIRLTSEGEGKLRRLSAVHHAELCNSGPLLVSALGTLLRGVGVEAQTG